MIDYMMETTKMRYILHLNFNLEKAGQFKTFNETASPSNSPINHILKFMYTH